MKSGTAILEEWFNDRTRETKLDDESLLLSLIIRTQMDANIGIVKLESERDAYQKELIDIERLADTFVRDAIDQTTKVYWKFWRDEISALLARFPKEETK